MVIKVNIIDSHIKIEKVVLVISDVNLIKTGTFNVRWFWKIWVKSGNGNSIVIGSSFKESSLKSPTIKLTCFVAAKYVTYPASWLTFKIFSL